MRHIGLHWWNNMISVIYPINIAKIYRYMYENNFAVRWNDVGKWWSQMQSRMRMFINSLCVSEWMNEREHFKTNEIEWLENLMSSHKQSQYTYDGINTVSLIILCISIYGQIRWKLENWDFIEIVVLVEVCQSNHFINNVRPTKRRI